MTSFDLQMLTLKLVKLNGVITRPPQDVDVLAVLVLGRLNDPVFVPVQVLVLVKVDVLGRPRPSLSWLNQVGS